jgi:hypothetical protein
MNLPIGAIKDESICQNGITNSGGDEARELESE